MPLRFVLLLLFVLAAGVSASAQTLPAVGTDATLDVATWNIEHFGNPGSGPLNEELQFQNVLAVLRQADVDVWSLQELDFEDTFDRLLDSLGADFDGQWFADETASFDIGYGFVWRTATITAPQVTKILTGSSFEFASRPPLQLTATVILPDTTVEVRFINVHMKAGASAEDYDRRLAASAILKNYTDNQQAVGRNIAILGDLNDELVQSIRTNEESPYRNFLDDADYLFATRDFDQSGSSGDTNTFCSSSTCSSGSVLDHIIATSPLADDYEAGSVARYDAALADITGYTSTTSDHVPVTARFNFGLTTPNEAGPPARTFALEAPYPNPFTDQATFVYTVGEAGPVRVELFDALGRRVAVLADENKAPGSYRVRLNGARLTPGLYVVRLTSETRTATRRLIRVR
ncbi:MAG: T9SS type A sorting domain-containing protein [Rhodothermaceae bacterium]|nr:T9SS type A sorting domain-containing protein [Rhodothermaceae bacterium]